MEISSKDRLQPPFPSMYKVPTLVKPSATISNILGNASNFKNINLLQKFNKFLCFDRLLTYSIVFKKQ